MPEPTELNCCPEGVAITTKALIKVRNRATQQHTRYHLLLPDDSWSTLVTALREFLPYVQWDCVGAAFVWQDNF